MEDIKVFISFAITITLFILIRRFFKRLFTKKRCSWCKSPSIKFLSGEQVIVEEMNRLGTSKADNARYDFLSGKRNSIYLECVPILEKLVSINGNKEAIMTLKNIFL